MQNIIHEDLADETVNLEMCDLMASITDSTTWALEKRRPGGRTVLKVLVNGSQYDYGGGVEVTIKGQRTDIVFTHTVYTKDIGKSYQVTESATYDRDLPVVSPNLSVSSTLLLDLRKFANIMHSCPVLPKHRYHNKIRFDFEGGYAEITDCFLTDEEHTSIKILSLARQVGFFSIEPENYAQIESNLNTLEDSQLAALDLTLEKLGNFNPENFWGWEAELLPVNKRNGHFPLRLRGREKSRAVLARLKEYLIMRLLDKQIRKEKDAKIELEQYDLAEQIEIESEKLYEQACRIVPEALEGDYHVLTLVHTESYSRHKVYLSRDKDKMFIESEHRCQEPAEEPIKFIFDCFPDNKEILRSPHTEEFTIATRDRGTSFVGVGSQHSVIGSLKDSDSERIRNIIKLLLLVSPIREAKAHVKLACGDLYYHAF